LKLALSTDLFYLGNSVRETFLNCKLVSYVRVYSAHKHDKTLYL